MCWWCNVRQILLWVFSSFMAKFWRIDVIYSSDAGLKVHSSSQCWVFPFWAVVETWRCNTVDCSPCFMKRTSAALQTGILSPSFCPEHRSLPVSCDPHWNGPSSVPTPSSSSSSPRALIFSLPLLWSRLSAQLATTSTWIPHFLFEGGRTTNGNTNHNSEL